MKYLIFFKTYNILVLIEFIVYFIDLGITPKKHIQNFLLWLNVSLFFIVFKNNSNNIITTK